MENIEKSELVIAKILGLLLEWGLSANRLEFSELGLDSEYTKFFSTCVEWLEAEGLIRTTKVHVFSGGEAIVVGPVLTARGLAIMGNRIKVGGTDTTIATAVKETTKETGYYTGFGDFSGGFVGGLLKSLQG
jgi:hypothetical protein